jgi:hypothetical protein
MTTEPTSGGTSETQVPPTPATGTPASSSETQTQKPALSLEDAIKRLTEAEHSLNNAKEENARHSKKLSAYEKAEKEAEAAKKAAEEAQLSEIERIKKQHTEAEQRIKQYQQQLVMAQVKLAAKDKNIVDPDLAALAIQDKLELDEQGMPTNLEKVLDDLIKNKPYLVKAEPAEPATTPTQTANQRTAPALPPFAGRSSIAAPNTPTPGRIPSWSDIYKQP